MALNWTQSKRVKEEETIETTVVTNGITVVVYGSKDFWVHRCNLDSCLDGEYIGTLEEAKEKAIKELRMFAQDILKALE